MGEVLDAPASSFLGDGSGVTNIGSTLVADCAGCTGILLESLAASPASVPVCDGVLPDSVVCFGRGDEFAIGETFPLSGVAVG